MKVLVATDGSDAAIEAARRAITLLRSDAEILLVTVIPDLEDPMETAGGFEGPVVSEEEAEHDFAEAAEAGSDALARTSAALGGGVEVRVVPGDEEPGHAIVAVAEQVHPDLVVIGSGGRSFFKRLFTGSVSDFVVHHAPCPVLVVRHDHPEG
jgi:nucleotide-binding universal stress UspA family protein